IGWTGSPASTSDLVDQVHRSREDKMVAYQLFLKNSTECVNEMIKGFKENNVTLIQQMIRKNRQLLHDLSAITGVVIETP
ncbi:phosphomevalonate kinase, partial [Enterococcus faecalis]